jgi:hypothetical protein
LENSGGMIPDRFWDFKALQDISTEILEHIAQDILPRKRLSKTLLELITHRSLDLVEGRVVVHAY